MTRFKILYDSPQEAEWFRSLHPSLCDADEEGITAARDWPGVSNVLAYDRPDIVLLDDGVPILVVEETVEVPSGHNVGQRFARIAAAAEASVPCLYFGPYVAKKHGGETAGPRYMNVRLFHAVDAMVRTTRTAVTTINWPVDSRFEVRRDKEKDADVREYLSTFLDLYENLHDLDRLNAELLNSPIQARMLRERNAFVNESIRNPGQYDEPPASVEILPIAEFMNESLPDPGSVFPGKDEIVQYQIGMNYLRSDPYTGMAMLYRYLYVAEWPSRALVLWFPNITEDMWRDAAERGKRKDVRLFRVAADAIRFSDQFLAPESL